MPLLREGFLRPIVLAPPMAYSSEQSARVRAVLGRRRGLTEKEMFGGIAFLLEGNMAVGVHGEDLIVRVDPAQTNTLLKEPGAKAFDLSGRAAPAGWLLVSPKGYGTEPALRTWVGRGIAYASSLPRKTRKAPSRR